MGMVMNVTGLGYDTPRLHSPVARIVEMSDIFCSQTMGGILESEGVLDMVNCLRRKDEAGFAGGVFVVVKLQDRVAGEMLKRKGHLVNEQGSHAMFYRPHHLLGVETGTSALAAALGISAAGGQEVRPRVDLCARTTQSLKAGTKLEMGHGHTLVGIDGELRPAQPIADDHAIPFYLAVDCILKVDVAADMLLTYGMLRSTAEEGNAHSALWALRRRQDALFFG
jgi:predicted homoserine dehydrogenase-like protein